MGVGCRFPGLSSLPRRPVPEGLHRRGQGREQQLRPDLVGQAERLQSGQQVLLNAGQGEHGAPAGDLHADRVHGLERGEVHFDVGLDVATVSSPRRANERAVTTSSLKPTISTVNAGSSSSRSDCG